MAPKPFGKPSPGRARFPRLTVIALLFLGASPVAYFALSSTSRSYLTLVQDAFFWPSAAVFGFFLAAAGVRWMKRRPTPRAPGEGPSSGVGFSRRLLALFLSAPFALSCAFLYQPGLTIINGWLSPGATRTAHALVEIRGRVPVLRSPYWPPDFQVEVTTAEVPETVPAGSLARLTLARGLLGVTWIRGIEFEEFR